MVLRLLRLATLKREVEAVPKKNRAEHDKHQRVSSGAKHLRPRYPRGPISK